MADNLGAGLLGGYIGSVGTASTSYLAGGGPAQGGAGPGGLSALTKTVLHIAVFWVISIAILILLHKTGFRFSLTVG